MQCVMDNLYDAPAFKECATEVCGTIFDIDISCEMQCYIDNLKDTAAMIKCETDTCGVGVELSPDGATVSKRSMARQTCNLECFFANQGDEDAQLACMEENGCPSD